MEANATLTEAEAAFERAKPLKKSGYLSDSTYDQRESAAKTAEAQLVAARDGLKLAEAEKAQVEAQRRELAWRRANTQVTAPADGLISRRTARIGGMARDGGAEPMFRIIARGEVELDAEVIETELGKIAVGQKAHITVAGVGEVNGTVRLVSPEVDKTTRLGRVRMFLGDDPKLRIGSFARGTIDTAQRPWSRGAVVRRRVRRRRRLRPGRPRRPRRTPRHRDRAHLRRPGRGARRARRKATSSSPRPAPSCATATPCAR